MELEIAVMLLKRSAAMVLPELVKSNAALSVLKNVTNLNENRSWFYKKHCVNVTFRFKTAP